MRFTVTLDDEVDAQLRAEMKRSGESFKKVVNRVLRLAFEATNQSLEEQPDARTGRRSNRKLP
jgi:predicted CopG family antitoxin